MADAIALADMIAPLRPYFVEDLLRSDNLDSYAQIRAKVKVPIAVGEVLGNKAGLDPPDRAGPDRLWPGHDPECGRRDRVHEDRRDVRGASYRPDPTFTGPIATATLVHCVAATSLPAWMEMAGGGRREWPYLEQGYDFRNGKLWINDRPGIGCEIDPARLQLMADYRERYAPIPTLARPDGSYTNW